MVRTDAGYDAFISYSHEKDKTLAPRLQSALQRIGKSWYVRRSLKVFRDETDLSATPEGWNSIQEALTCSRFLILLASESAAQSKWVQMEVVHWLRLGRIKNLLIVLTSGNIQWNDATGDFDWSITSALPASLRGAFMQEPFWADLRSADEPAKRSARNPEFQLAVAKLGAPLRGMSPDVLISHDYKEYRRTIRHAVTAAILLAASTLAAVGFGVLARSQRAVAIAQRNESLVRQLAAQARLDMNDSGDAFTRSALLVAESLKRGVVLDAYKAWYDIASLMPRARQRELRHAAEVTSMAYAPDGATLASASSDGLVHLWTRDSGVQTRQWTHDHWDPPQEVRFVGDGSLLVSVGEHSVLLWRVASGEPVARFRIGRQIDRLLATRDARTLVALDREDEIHVLRVAGSHEDALAGIKLSGSDVALVEEDRSLAIAHPDGRIVVLDLETGRERFHLETGAPLERLAGDPAGHRLAAAGADGVIRVWDVEQRAIVARIAHGERVHQLEFGRSGRTIAAAGDRRMTISDAVSGALHWTEPLQASLQDLVYDDDSGMVLTLGREADYAQLWDVAAGREACRFAGDGAIRGIAMYRAALQVATAGADGKGVLWSASCEAANKRFEASPDPVRAAYVPGGERVVVVTRRGEISSWPTSTGPPGLQIGAHPAAEKSEVALDGDLVARQDDAFKIHVWSGTDGRELASFAAKGAVHALDVSAVHLRVTALGSDGTVHLWSLDDPGRALALRPRQPVKQAKLGTDGQWLLSAGGESFARLWKLPEGTEIGRLENGGNVERVWVGPGGAIATTPNRDKLMFWDARSRAVEGSLPIREEVDDLAYSLDGKFVAFGTDDRNLVLWDRRRSREVARMKLNSPSEDLSFSRDGRLLLVRCRYRNGVIVLDGATGRQRFSTSNSSEIVDASLSPDGKLVGVTTRDGIASVWSTEDGNEMMRLDRDGHIAELAFAPGSDSLSTVTTEGVVKVWPLSPASLVQALCDRLDRNLRPDEWTRFFPGEPYRATCPRGPHDPFP